VTNAAFTPEVLSKLSPRDLKVLIWRQKWLLTARAKQLPPDNDDWSEWGVLAGRGFGKSLTASQWIAFEALTDPRGMVGFSFQATKDAFYGQYAPGHLLLLTYESLTRNPSATMRAVYQFIGEPWFEHDFEHISYNADEFDARVGMPGLHTVRPKVEPIERAAILPREIFGRFANESFWMDPKNNISQVPVV